MFNVPNKKYKRLILDGNSLFARAGSLANGQYIGLNVYNGLTGTRPCYFNYAIAGRNCTQLISNYPTLTGTMVTAGDIVLFWELTNDIKQNSLTAAQAYANLITYAGLVHASGGLFVTISMISRDQGGTEGSGIEVTRLAVNALLNADHSFCDGYLDAGGLTQFDSQAKTTNTTYYESDQLHLTDAGYEIIRSALQPIIQSLI